MKIDMTSVDEPKASHHYGGDVSGPVFSKIAADSMQVLGIHPDIPLTPFQLKLQRELEASRD
jgi:hypothetical protein